MSDKQDRMYAPESLSSAATVVMTGETFRRFMRENVVLRAGVDTVASIFPAPWVVDHGYVLDSNGEHIEFLGAESGESVAAFNAAVELCRKREGEAAAESKLVSRVSVTSVKFPDIGCDGLECGFVRAGVGWQCREGEACGRYIHPGDEHYDEVAAYYRRENSDDDRREGEP